MGIIASKRAQSAMEYFMTYVWAIILVLILVSIMYLFIARVTAIPPTQCSFSSGAYCEDMLFGSNTTASKVAIFLTNMQQYPILNPQLSINASNVGVSTASCSPNFVLPGGAIICYISIPNKAVSLGSLVNGQLYLKATPCPSGNASSCSTATPQTYSGSFTSHSTPILATTPISIVLSVKNSTEVTSVPDQLVATVKMLGYPVSSASVDFVVLQGQNSTINPAVVASGANGEAVSYVSSMQPGTVSVYATFGGAKSNIVSINFTTAEYVTFKTTNMQGTGSSAILYVDGTPYTYSQFPLTFAYVPKSSHTYSFESPISGGKGTRYIFASASGCGTSQQQGTIVATSNCTVTAAYTTQYYLNVSASPKGAATVTPNSGYYDASSNVTISVSASNGNKFKGWLGTGVGSYTGMLQTANVVMDSPINETANMQRAVEYVTFNAVTNPSYQTAAMSQVNGVLTYPSIYPIKLPYPHPISTTTTTVPPVPTVPVLYVDGTPYTYSQLPVTFAWQQGSTHTYSYVGNANINSSARYNLSSVSGCGVNGPSGTITATHSCAVNANYIGQYLFSMSISSAQCPVYSSSPRSGWYDFGSKLTLFISTNYRCYVSWQGSGTISYSGTGAGYITMYSPISEYGYTHYIIISKSSSSSSSSSSPISSSSSSSPISSSSSSSHSSSGPSSSSSWHSSWHSSSHSSSSSSSSHSSSSSSSKCHECCGSDACIIGGCSCSCVTTPCPQ